MYDKDPSEIGPHLIGEMQGSLDDHVLGLTNRFFNQTRMNVTWGSGHVWIAFLEDNQTKAYALLEPLLSNTTIEVTIERTFDREPLINYIREHQTSTVREDLAIDGTRYTVMYPIE